MSATSFGVVPPGKCLWSKGRYGSCGWQVKLCDPLLSGHIWSALEMRCMKKRYTNRRSFLYIITDLEFSRLESWSRDPFLQVLVSVLVLKPRSLGLGLETSESWSWSWNLRVLVSVSVLEPSSLGLGLGHSSYAKFRPLG